MNQRRSRLQRKASRVLSPEEAEFRSAMNTLRAERDKTVATINAEARRQKHEVDAKRASAIAKANETYDEARDALVKQYAEAEAE